ncbi:MAG: tetratricopeptide repeat protein [Pyrinomonadaceae bacterium]|nr:tetratricopeptide repeat protein [Pyrinomonadaceae bacterium]
MVFEKAKVLKAAEKFLSQGKINAAIKEYRQIVENDEDDLTTLNMLGDLCVREGRNEEAISCFTRIAEHYREQEFNLKAIAMYKKIERLQPRDPAIASKLATLYAIEGLTADARAQYLIVADAFTRAGKTIETFEILHKVADLDPHNTEIRLKLAEGYLKENLGSEATRAFLEAATRLFDTGQFEKALKAYSRALEIRPNEDAALRGVVSAHVALGSADEAAELLEGLLGERPDDPELLSLLARTYIDAENATGAERVIGSIVAHDASKYTRFIEVARLHLNLDQVNEATRVLSSITEQLLAGREENDLQELVQEVLARNPEHIEALRLLVRIHWWQRDMDRLRLALERLAEAAQAAGLDQDERYALTQLARLVPDEQRYAERLDALGGAAGEAVEEVAFAMESSLSDVPSFEDFGAADYNEASTVATDETLPADQFEWNSVSEEAAPDPSSSFADLNEETLVSYGVESSVEGFESGNVALDESLSGPDGPAQPGGDSRSPEAILRQELESVDFYITQGYADIAADTLDLMERQFGSHPDIDARREQLPGQPVEVSVASAPPRQTFGFGGTEQAAEEATDIDITLGGIGEMEAEAAQVLSASDLALSDGTKGIDAGLAEIFEEFREAAEEEPTSNQDYETHYNMGTAYKEMELLDEAIQEFQTAANLAKPSDGTSRYLQCCNMLGHCFVNKGMPRAAVLWFKKGLEAPGQADEEYKALRYELGSAYQQMGEINRALEIFTEVYGVDVSYRGVADKLQELQAQKQEVHEQKKVKKKRK